MFFLIVFNETVLAQDSSQSKAPESLQWWQVATGIIGVISAVIGVPAAYWLSKKTRLETRKLQLEILEKEGQLPQQPPKVLSRHDVIESPQAVLTGIQGFIIRFIILYVAVFAWGIIERLLSPFVGASLSYWLSGHQEISQKWFTILTLTFYSQLTGIGDIIIFLLLGWPLLSDIARFVGVRPLKLLRKR